MHHGHSQQFLSVTPDRAVVEVIALMAQQEQNALVVDRGQPVGMFAERDVVRAIAAGIDIATTPVGAIMQPVKTANDLSETDEQPGGIARMSQLDRRHPPVVDDCERAVEPSLLEESLLKDAHLKNIRNDKEPLPGFSCALEQSPCGYHALDATGRILQINVTELNMLGYPLEAVYGRPFIDFIHPADIETYMQKFAQMEQRGWVRELEVGLQRRDGSTVPVSITANAVYDRRGNYLMSRSVVMNISDRRQREAFLYSIYYNTAQAIFIIDVTPEREFYYLDFNPVSEQYSGVTNAQLRGKTPEAIFGEAVGTHLRRNYERCLDAGTTITYEECNQFEGHLLWTLTTLCPLYDEQGNIYRLIGTAIDITDRKQAELAMRESEEKFRQFALHADAVIWIAQVDSLDNLYVSPAYEKVWGRSCESLCRDPLSWLDSVHPSDREWVAGYMMKHRQVGLVDTEYRIIRPDGSVRWIWDRGFVIRDDNGQIARYGGIAQDITDRKAIEEALKASEQRLYAILDNSPAVIYMYDLQDRYLLVNRLCAQLVGATPADLVGKNVYEVWDKAIADRFAANNREVLATGKLVQTEELAPHEDGLHTYLTVKFPLFDLSGAPYAVCGISTDITEKKQLEEQFYRAQRMESLGTLASGIAHDLNNVFTPILTIAQLLQFDAENGRTLAAEMLQILVDSARRGADLVNQVLTFARGFDGKQMVLQVGCILQETANILKQTFPKSIAIAFNIPVSKLALISADPTQVNQVLMNLCVNARDAMPHGGTLAITAENRSIDAAYAKINLDARAGEYVVVTIADTGSGMAPRLLERIFEPFFTTKEIGKGTGLGLSTALGIVKNHGGFIHVASEVGKGTQFQVFFPAIPGTVRQDQTAKPILYGNGEPILVVDDEVLVRETVREILEDRSYRVLTAADGLEAIARYREHQSAIAAVMIDMMMPNMDGFSTIESLKAIDPAVRIIAVSGLPANRQPALAAGAKLFLTKPYSMEELLGSFHHLLHQAMSHQATDNADG